ncbi:alpha/beta fold hydrolase [Halapricum desulfuricans]|uniref:alpha/beta fold hydrolase n=1 Tax=Halapricum desulfuricans TaxID=2841257 RepID=UPI001E344CB7|nr:alpha/beta fold hydrolase [Halapricum desulfuricans]
MGRVRTWLAHNRERLAVWVVVIALLVVAGLLLYFGTPFHGSDASVQSVQNDDRIDLQRVDGGYVMQPASGGSTTGLVFYPGARVHPDAYLASLSPLVTDAEVTVVIVKVPLNLAVVDQNAASDVIGSHGVEQWYVGGHSLGGAMACRYAGANRERVAGVVLLGSYCDRSIAGTDLRVLSVTGDADTVLDRSAYERNRANLPADATVVELSGVNHTQFGSYTGQRGDRPSGTSYELAHRRLANVTVPWFEKGSESAPGPDHGVSRETDSHSIVSPTSANTIRLRTP